MSCSVKNLGGGTELIKEETYTYTETNTYFDNVWLTYSELKSLLGKYKKIFMSVEGWEGAHNADYVIACLSTTGIAVGNNATYSKEIDCNWFLDALKTLENQSVSSSYKESHQIQGANFSGRLRLRYASTTSNYNDIQLSTLTPNNKKNIEDNIGLTVRCYISGTASTTYSTIIKWKLWGIK